MFRNYDWECQACFVIFDRIVSYPQDDPAPRILSDVESENTDCPYCGEDASIAERCISITAPYTGEQDLSPKVCGGRFDTMGYKQAERPQELGWMPKNASYQEARDFVSRPIYREWKKEKAAVRKENVAKQARAAAKSRGENVNFRRDKLPGDPKVTS